ncbi:MAG: formylglycine-generating enzyme family protein [bacterium]|nr:formylglycine-generating enzyme family protein [bacterium]
MRTLAIMLMMLVFYTGLALANEPPQVINVRAVQRTDTTLVDITYDLADADGDTLFVSVAILDSAGVDTVRQAVTFSGDVGAGVRSGVGKNIVWNVGSDLPDTFRKYVAVVTAGDGPFPGGGGLGEMIRATLLGGATMDFVYIAPGTFTMGSPDSEEGRSSDEGPQHQVTISQGFYLGKYEVTQAQWQAVMGTTPWLGQNNVQANPDNPTVYVSWNDAQQFVHKLNVTAGDSLYRLPTEAEWEYACRAGTTSRWSFGDDESKLGEYAWYSDNYQGYAQKVGTKLANPWGLFDMHGNVWEWCLDRYGDYVSSTQVDPQGPVSGSSRVGRGGSFYNYAQSTRSAFRIAGAPDFTNRGIGFRLLRRTN